MTTRTNAALAHSKPTIVTDFDGTLADVDVGDRLCELFAEPGEPSWLDFDRRFVAGELSLPEAQRGMWRLVRGSLADLRDAALRFAKLRDGADALFAAASRGEIRLIIASGGFDFYIEALLGERIGLLHAAYYNAMHGSPTGLVPHFPHTHLACARCAVCKGKVIADHAQYPTDNGARVLFCGDGTSDRCAADSQAELFAVAGSSFERYLRDAGRAHTPFSDYREVLAAL